MRKVEKQIIKAFYENNKKTIDNTMTDGESVWLFGNKIMKKAEDGIYISTSGWNTITTRSRINALIGFYGYRVSTKNRQCYLNGREWDGSWFRIAAFQNNTSPKFKQGELVKHTSSKRIGVVVEFIKEHSLTVGFDAYYRDKYGNKIHHPSYVVKFMDSIVPEKYVFEGMLEAI